MRPLKMFLAICLLACVLAAAVLPVSAIGFDAEEIYASVFVITAGDSLGSGFAIGENCVITNAHVVEGESAIQVQTYDGTEMPATLRNIDTTLDLAILVVRDASFTPLIPADPSLIKIGDDIYTIGAPNSLSYTLTKGVISTKSRKVDGQDYIQIDAPINGGNSGGPLLNEQGQVLGVNTLKYRNSEGLGFSIPITVVQQYLTDSGIQLTQTGTVIGRLGENGEQYSSSGAQISGEGSASGTQQGQNKLLWLIPVLVAVAIIVLLVLWRIARTQKQKAAYGSVVAQNAVGPYQNPAAPGAPTGMPSPTPVQTAVLAAGDSPDSPFRKADASLDAPTEEPKQAETPPTPPAPPRRIVLSKNLRAGSEEHSTPDTGTAVLEETDS